MWGCSKEVAESLTGIRRLGQSRSAEYGQVRIAPVDGEAEPEPKYLEDPKVVLLHLLADMAVLDECGQPAPCPLPQWLGLPAGKLCLERSFLKHRSFNPFNGALRRYEQERQAIGAGSVLCFVFDQEPNMHHLAARCRHGLGLYRQTGMGRVRLNPDALRVAERELTTFDQKKARLKQLEVGKKPEEEPLKVPTPPDHPLARWLADRQAITNMDEAARARANLLTDQLRIHYQNAIRLAGVPPGVRVGPSPSQWGRVRDLARNHELSLEQIRAHLFEGKEAVCHVKDPAWKADFPTSEDHKDDLMTFGEWLKSNLINQKTDQPELNIRVLAHLSRQAISLAREIEEAGL